MKSSLNNPVSNKLTCRMKGEGQWLVWVWDYRIESIAQSTYSSLHCIVVYTSPSIIRTFLLKHHITGWQGEWEAKVTTAFMLLPLDKNQRRVVGVVVWVSKGKLEGLWITESISRERKGERDTTNQRCESIQYVKYNCSFKRTVEFQETSATLNLYLFCEVWNRNFS